MKKKIQLLFLVISIIAVTMPIYAQEDAELFLSAKQSIKAGEKDFAFIQFHSLLRLSTNSPYYQDALFATGEYYFACANYYDAYTSFSKFVELYPQSEALPFAVVYLLKMEQMQSQDSEYDLKKKVITFKQLSLLFSEYKEYPYQSPMGLKYKAVYFIDRLEVYINEELFETVYF
ncbi:MAG: outer membrane protein assembly factor BamD [Candidatus Omnitrophica bacterium]|nr:outer membrane protein assembly factor BamD [Candidatus Omnitrophota bacterium]